MVNIVFETLHPRRRNTSMLRIILLLTILCTVTSNAQFLFTPDAGRHIEILLLDLRYPEAKQFADSTASCIDTSGFSTDVRKKIADESKEYREFFDQWETQSGSPELSQKITILQSAVMLGDRYEERIAGSYSHQAFQKASSAFQKEEYENAFRFYRLANFCKTRFFSLERFRLRTRYDLVRSLVAQKDFRSAAGGLDALIMSEKSNPTFIELRDSIAWMQAVVNEKIGDAEARARRDSSNEIFGSTVGITLGVEPFYTSSMNDLSWNLRSTTNNQLLLVQIGALRGGSGICFNIQGSFYYSPVFSQQIHVKAGSLTYSSLDINNTAATIALKQSLISYGTSLKYSFSEMTGLRSFVSGGIGFIWIERQEQQIYFADLLVGSTRYKEYVILGETFSSPEVTGEFGLEYFSGSLSRFFFDGSIGVKYLTASQTTVSPVYFSMSIRAGIFIF